MTYCFPDASDEEDSVVSVVDEFVSVEATHATEELVGSLVVINTQFGSVCVQLFSVEIIFGCLSLTLLLKIDIGRARHEHRGLELHVRDRFLQFHVLHLAVSRE